MSKIKRRKSNKFLSNYKIIIIFIVVISLSLLLGIGYAVLNQNQTITGTAKIKTESVCDLDITSSFVINSSWGGENDTTVYNATLIVNNNSLEDIEGWTIKIKGPSDLVVSTNATITVDDEGVSTLVDLGWNGQIKSGESISLDLGLTTIEKNLDLEYIIFNGCTIYGDGTSSGEVEIDPTVKLTNLSITPSEYSMSIGDTLTMQVEKTPANANATLSWSSSNESVVSVTQDGLITALSLGSSVITAESGNISSSATISVTEKVNPTNTDVSIVFEKTGDYWGDESSGYTMDFNITITNNSDSAINSVKFTLNVPEGTTYSLWTSGASVTNNDFTYEGEIGSTSSVILYGQISYPANTIVDNYLTPDVINIVVN